MHGHSLGLCVLGRPLMITQVLLTCVWSSTSDETVSLEFDQIKILYYRLSETDLAFTGYSV